MIKHTITYSIGMINDHKTLIYIIGTELKLDTAQSSELIINSMGTEIKSGINVIQVGRRKK